MRTLYKFFSSLGLTVTLLAFSMLLVLLATFEQVQWGVFEVQKRYFETFICMWTYPAQWPGANSLDWLKIPLPGGFLLGGLLILNLLCAHFRYFRASWRKSGIVILHTGVVLLLISGFLTAYLQQEYFMWINVGAKSNYLESFHDLDLVFIDHTDPKMDTIVSIPTTMLDPNQPIHHEALPFTVKTVYYYPNSTFLLRSQNPTAPEMPADHGIATNRDLAVVPEPYNFTENAVNLSTAVVSIETDKGPIGKWLVSTFLDPKTAPPFFAKDLPQTFTVDGHKWEVTLRPRREYLPYTLRLDKFTHDLYPGTTIPKRFESQVQLTNPAHGEDRPVLIYMNHPLRYRGETFYQSGFEKDDTATILQVVHNPSFVAPYIACIIVGAGLLFQFLYHFAEFSRKRNTVPAP